MKLASERPDVERPGPASAGRHPAALLDDGRHPLLHVVDEAERQAPGQLGDGVEVVRAARPAPWPRPPRRGRRSTRGAGRPATTSWSRCGSRPAGRSSATSVHRRPRRELAVRLVDDDQARGPLEDIGHDSRGRTARPVGLLGQHRNVDRGSGVVDDPPHPSRSSARSSVRRADGHGRAGQIGRCGCAGRRSVPTRPPSGRARRRRAAASAAPRWTRWHRTPARARHRGGRPRALRRAHAARSG